jgi:hypothetical protein
MGYYIEIDSICERYGIKKYIINDIDGTVDVYGDVHFYYKELKKIPVNNEKLHLVYIF